MINVREATHREEMERRAERERFELVRGDEIVVSPVGFEHGDLVLAFGPVLRAAARRAAVGRVVTEVGFWLAEDVLLAPNLALVPPEAVPLDPQKRRMIEGAPRLAVEIASPSQESGALAEKIDLYLAAGVDPVWVLYPSRRLVAVHRPEQPVRLLRGDDILDGGDAIPGFRLAVAAIYALVDPA